MKLKTKEAKQIVFFLWNIGKNLLALIILTCQTFVHFCMSIHIITMY